MRFVEKTLAMSEMLQCFQADDDIRRLASQRQHHRVAEKEVNPVGVPAGRLCSVKGVGTGIDGHDSRRTVLGKLTDADAISASAIDDHPSLHECRRKGVTGVMLGNDPVRCGVRDWQPFLFAWHVSSPQSCSISMINAGPVVASGA
jgi:hypothetical protein